MPNTKTTKSKPTPNLPVPSQFGSYEIVSHLGMGGMGDVYKALHLTLDRTVALKVLPIALTTDEYRERFNAEALAISRLQHQNIVTLYDYGEHDSRRYIAMQFINGSTLSDIIKKEKLLTYERIIKFSKHIGRALKYAHNKNIIHRDVKSSNIMVNTLDQAVLSDFGLAQRTGATRLTTTGMAIGTPEYMAPEQCEGKPIDCQCDIYALGVVMYELVAGKPPFTGDNPLAIAYKQVNETPPFLSKKRRDIPPTFEMIIAKCLKKDLSERYKNADELLKDLDTVEFQASTKKQDIDSFYKTEKHNTLENRITDRRDKDRRQRRKSSSSKKKWGFLIIGVAVLAYILFLKLSLSQLQNQAIPHWIKPTNIKQKTAKGRLIRQKQAKLAFDSDPASSWKSPLNNKPEHVLQLQFSEMFLIQGFTLLISMSDANPNSVKPLFQVELHNNGQTFGPFIVTNAEEPQFISVVPFWSSGVEFKIISLPSPNKAKKSFPKFNINEIDFLAMPLPHHSP